jgi:predicted TIM-barrel fold metal-dependent hydrolase
VKPVLLISSDCHGGNATPEQWKDYLPKEYHDQYDEGSLARRFAVEKDTVVDVLGRIPAFFYPDEILEEYRDQLDERRVWNGGTAAERLPLLEAEGYVGEVIFPDAAVPFSGNFFGFGGYAGLDPHAVELALVGQRAYNRRLADIIDPARQVGCAIISYADIDRAVAMVHDAAAWGLRGVLLDGADPSYPQASDPIFHPRYDPLWSAIEETGLVAHFHLLAGSPLNLYGPDFPEQIPQIELAMYGQRILWWLIWGGVFERHPRLTCAFTEMGTAWIARALRYMDWQWEGMTASRYDRRNSLLPIKPSDYWKRQCFSGASLMSLEDLEARDLVDISTIMFGTDFAHPEGTWSRTQAYLRAAFSAAKCTEAEVRKICGENAARCYKFDMDVLQPIVERVGPPIERVLGPGDEKLDDPLLRVLNRPDFIGVM